MSVNIKVTGGLNIEWGQIDPKATGGLRSTSSWTSKGDNSICEIGPTTHGSLSSRGQLFRPVMIKKKILANFGDVTTNPTALILSSPVVDSVVPCR